LRSPRKQAPRDANFDRRAHEIVIVALGGARTHRTTLAALSIRKQTKAAVMAAVFTVIRPGSARSEQ